MTSSATKVAAATAAFAAVHSLLASRAAKAAAERWLGPRGRDGLYRPLYNAVAVGATAALVAYVRRQPNRVLYRVRGPAAKLMRLGQVAALAAMADASWRIGPARFAGLPNLWAWLAGRRDVPREPEGQSPPPGPDGRFAPGGAFGVSRNPANLLPVPLLWLNPRMTADAAAMAAVMTAYFYVGSVLSDRRLRRRYGPAYADYQARVPLYLPGVVARSAPGPSDGGPDEHLVAAGGSPRVSGRDDARASARG